VRLVAEMLGQLGRHRPLHQPLRQLREHTARPDDLLLRPSAREQLVDHLVSEAIANRVRKLERLAADRPLRSPSGLAPRPAGALNQIGTGLRRHDAPSISSCLHSGSHTPRTACGKTRAVEHSGHASRHVRLAGHEDAARGGSAWLAFRMTSVSIVRRMDVGIVSREAELAAIGVFVAEEARGAAALILEGAAGIGKTMLWRAGVAQARGRGLHVLASQPAEAEKHLAHVGLNDLFEGVLDDVLPALSPPRRRALEVALLMAEVAGDRIDQRALGLAMHGALRILSEREPLLIAVDDVQWLDRSSSAALAFALRRLPSEDVRLLLARRLDEGARSVDLVTALDAERVQRVSVGPLSVGALHRFLRERLGRPFARQTLLRIHERSGGNPFFALELARVVDREIDLLEPLRVPETLAGLMRARIAGLPESTHEGLALLSALGTASLSLLERAGLVAEALEPAMSSHLIEREGGLMRFTHPLLSSVIYQNLGADRRRVHGRIAGLVDDPLLRARHLALSRDAPDADTAALLDEAATLAADRGAFAVAAELFEHALRLTASDASDARCRRALAAARSYHDAGEWTRARSIATDLLAVTSTGVARADILILLSEFEVDDRAVPLLEEALREASGRPALQALVHIRLALARRFRKGFAAALEDARAAFEIAEGLGGSLRCEALFVLTALGLAGGDADAPAHAAKAHELAAATGDSNLLKEANTLLAAVRLDRGDVGEARRLLEREYAEWRERDEPFSAEVLWKLAWVELAGGCWELAADYADRARDISMQYEAEKNQDYIPSSWIALHRGQLEVARQQSSRGLELCKEQIGLLPPLLLAVPGLAALWSGDASDAVEWLGKADRQAATLGWREAARRAWTADYVEALLAIERIPDAIRVLDLWESDAVRLGRRPVLAHVARCRGLVAAALGDVELASSLLRLAVTEHEQIEDGFGRARALLALGIVLRRARQKRAARDAIRAALAGFEQLGAAGWVEKAHTELGSIGGRTRAEGLTAAESRVASLVAQGRTNREVAAALFLGERTVAGHLTHIYAKLGVRSRAELARRLH